MSEAYLFAALNPIFWSTTVILYRKVVPAGANPKTLMIFNQLLAMLCVAVFTGIPDYSSFETGQLILLLVAGICWSVGVYIEVLALEHLEAAASGVVGACRYLLTLMVGTLLLGEALSAARILGGGLIIISVLAISDFGRASYKKGFYLQLMATVPQLLAFAIDKSLTAELPVSAVAISAYFFPGIIFLILYPKAARLIPAEVRNSKGWLILIPPSLAGCYYATVKAFSLGEFVPIMAIVESCIITNWIFGYIFLQERERPLRNSISCIVCLVGVLLVCSN